MRKDVRKEAIVQLGWVELRVLTYPPGLARWTYEYGNTLTHLLSSIPVISRWYPCVDLGELDGSEER